jgi:hypothetical protein
VRSTGTRGVTIVTLVVMIFAPIFHNGKQDGVRKVGEFTTSFPVMCARSAPCPAQKTVVEKVTIPWPSGMPTWPSPRSGNNN